MIIKINRNYILQMIDENENTSIARFIKEKKKIINHKV
jgi:hypothetical protein